MAFIEIALGVAILLLAVTVSKRIASGRTPRADNRGATADYQAWRRGQESHERTVAKQLEMYRLQVAERQAARESYERIVRDKLDVIKTALAMDYERADLEALDARLEQLIGKDKLEALVDEELDIPYVDADLADTDLEAEIERLQRGRARDEAKQ